MNKKLKSVKIKIDWYDEDFKSSYSFYLSMASREQFNKLYEDKKDNLLYTNGILVPKNGKCLARMLLIDNPSEVTIAHECLHATLDLFRSSCKVSLGKLLDVSDDNIYGEEAFCHAHSEIMDKVLNGISKLKGEV